MNVPGGTVNRDRHRHRVDEHGHRLPPDVDLEVVARYRTALDHGWQPWATVTAGHLEVVWTRTGPPPR